VTKFGRVGNSQKTLTFQVVQLVCRLLHTCRPPISYTWFAPPALQGAPAHANGIAGLPLARARCYRFVD
jgi:hypothetical protein